MWLDDAVSNFGLCLCMNFWIFLGKIFWSSEINSDFNFICGFLQYKRFLCYDLNSNIIYHILLLLLGECIRSILIRIKLISLSSVFPQYTWKFRWHVHFSSEWMPDVDGKSVLRRNNAERKKKLRIASQLLLLTLAHTLFEQMLELSMAFGIFSNVVLSSNFHF